MSTVTKTETKSAAQKAVHYILLRVLTDRNFSYYMWGTEALKLCIAAEAERIGMTEKELEKQLIEASELATESRGKTDILALEERLRKIEQKGYEMRDRGFINSDKFEMLSDLF